MRSLYYKKSSEEDFDVIYNCDGIETKISTCKSIDECEFLIESIKEVLGDGLTQIEKIVKDGLNFQELLKMAIVQIRKLKSQQFHPNFTGPGIPRNPISVEPPTVGPCWSRS